MSAADGPPTGRCATASPRREENAARGEVSAVLAGDARVLCLTLGALAEIEAGLGVAGVGGLAERMRVLAAADLLVVLAALLRGGGETALADGLAGSGVEPAEAARAVARAFEAAAG